MKEGVKRRIFSRTVPKFSWPETTSLINDVIINLCQAGRGRIFICIEKPISHERERFKPE